MPWWGEIAGVLVHNDLCRCQFRARYFRMNRNCWLEAPGTVSGEPSGSARPGPAGVPAGPDRRDGGCVADRKRRENETPTDSPPDFGLLPIPYTPCALDSPDSTRPKTT